MDMSRGGSPAIVYDDAVDPADLENWERDLNALVERTAPLFRRMESQRHGGQYLRGMLSPLARKNGWTIAEHVGEAEPKALQRLLNLSPWNADDLLTLNREYAMEHLSDPGAILVADPTGFAKKGNKSVGVQRQYSGTLGRVDNCQISTFLAYVTPGRDRVLIDHRLYLPERSWVADPDRCAAAGVPAEVTFQTRPQQVQDMIEAAGAVVPFAWFTADEEFGQNPALCTYLETGQLPYVMGIPKNTLFLDTTGNSREINHYARSLRPGAWSRRACGIGSKGPRVYDWALVDSSTPEVQYLIRKAIDDSELAFYRCYNPHHARIGDLAHVAGARWPIEECFGASKNETGLDHYQVRTWKAFHRHIAFAMLAHTFLAVTAHKAKQNARSAVAQTSPPTEPQRESEDHPPTPGPIEPG